VELEHRSSTRLKLRVTGNLTLHGITQSIAVPVDAEMNGDAITSRGRFVVKQTDFGMTPVSVAGGMVSVKDALVVHFTVVSPLGSTR
jgi:polyisoprenoid-binding protein YceI